MQLLLVAETGEGLFVVVQRDSFRHFLFLRSGGYCGTECCRASLLWLFAPWPVSFGRTLGTQAPAVTSSSNRRKSGPANSAIARSYFAIPQDQKSKSTVLAPC